MSESHKQAAALRGAARTQKMEQAFIEAMRSIEAEMKANGGIYPHRGGAVSMAELARRANISESNFYKKTPGNSDLKARASQWLETLKRTETVGRVRAKKALAERADDWAEKYAALELRHIRTELELQSVEAQLQKLSDENAAMLVLLHHQRSSKVSPIKTPGS